MIYFFPLLSSLILRKKQNNKPTHGNTRGGLLFFMKEGGKKHKGEKGERERTNNMLFCSLLIKSIDSSFTWGKLYFTEHLSKHHMFIGFLLLRFCILFLKRGFDCFKLFLYLMVLIPAGTMWMSLKVRKDQRMWDYKTNPLSFREIEWFISHQLFLCEIFCLSRRDLLFGTYGWVKLQ